MVRLAAWVCSIVGALLGSYMVEAETLFGLSGGYSSIMQPYEVTCTTGICGTLNVVLSITRTPSAAMVNLDTVMVSTRPYIISSLSANATIDYTPLSNYLVVFNPGDSIKTITVAVLTSGVYAQTSYFEVYLSTPSAGTSIDSARANSFVAILGSVGSFSFASNNFTFLETEGTVQIPIVRTGGVSGAVTLQYVLEDPELTTAIMGTNFVLDSPVVEFADGQTMANLTVNIVHTPAYEYYSMFFVLELMPPADRGQLGNVSLSRIIIADAGDAGIFEFSTPSIICREDNGTATVWINRTVGMSTSAVAPVTLTVETVAGGNATEGSSRAYDYQHASQIMSWADGETAKSFSVTIFNNADYEPKLKSVWIQLTAVSGGAMIAASRNMTVVYIVDDRDAGTLSFTTSNYSVSEDAATVTLSLLRTGAFDPDGINTYTSGSVTVDVLTYSGVVMPGLSLTEDGFDYGVVTDLRCTHVSPCTAVAGQHYTAMPVTTLTFASGEASKSINIPIHNNDLYEAPNRVFKVLLRNVQGGAHIGLDYEHPAEWNPSLLELDRMPQLVPNFISAIVTIEDDGDPAVLITKASLSTSELGQTDTYSIKLNSIPTSPVAVSLSVHNPQVTVSSSQVVFTPSNWNVPQSICVSATDDSVAQSIHVVHVTHATASTDPRYNGGVRQTLADSGVVYGRKVYTETLGDYEQGNDQHAFEWDASEFGVLSAPASPILNVFVLDNDFASILVIPEQNRHTTMGPSNFVCARKNGHVAAVTLALSSKPAATVTLSLVPTSPDVEVTPLTVTLTPGTWRSGVVVAVTYSGSVMTTSRVDISSASADSFYAAKTSSFFVEGFPGAGVVLNKATETYHENGTDAFVDYDVTIVAEPMHWEVGNASAAVPYTHNVGPVHDVSAVKSSATISLVNGPVLFAATNSSESTTSSSVQKVAFLRFPRGRDVVDRTGSPRVGLALLRLYRLGGGDNRGLGGVQVGVFRPPTPSAWNETSCDAECVATLLPATNPFGFVLPTALSGTSNIVPEGLFNASQNTYVTSPGWVDIDVTAAWNTNATDLTDITFAVLALRNTPFIYDNVDEMEFASSDHPNESLRPYVQLTASGFVNVARSGAASQSSGSVNASQVLDVGSTLLERDAWWMVHWKDVRFIESIVLSAVVPVPQSSTISLSLVHDGTSVANTSMSLVTTSPFEPVQWTWHVHGQRGAVDPFSSFLPNLTAPVEATTFRIDSHASSLTLLSVQVFQIPMAASRVVIGGYLPSPSTLLPGLNELHMTADDPIVADHRPCTSSDICRNELLFTSGQWQDPQTVHVSVLNNDVATGPRVVGISHMSLSSDVDYDSPQVGFCTTSACTSSLQTTLSLSILDDDKAGVVVSTASVQLIEGASVFPGAPVPITIEQWHVSNGTICSWNAQTRESTSCRGVFSGAPFTVCLAPSSPLFSNGSAWIFLPLEQPQPTFQLREVRLELLSGSVRVPKTVSLWTSGTSTRDVSMWTLLARQAIPFGKTSIRFADFATVVLPFLAVHIEASYDVATNCTDISSIQLWGDVRRRDVSAVYETRLSKTHQNGESASIAVRLLSEPLAEVIVFPITTSPDLVEYDSRNLSQNAASLRQVVGNVYSYASYSAILPTALHFNASTWNVTQYLVLAAVDDNVHVGNRTSACIYTTSSADATASFQQSTVSLSVSILDTSALPLAHQYNSTSFVVSDSIARDPSWPYHVISSQTSQGSIVVTAAITEDDMPGITVTPSPLEVVENSAQPFNFSVVLDSQPTATLTLEMSVGLLLPSAQANLVSLQPTSLTFSPATWYVRQYVYVSVPYKAGFEGNESSTVRYAPTVPKKQSELIVEFTATTGDVTYHGLHVGTNDRMSVACRANGIPLIVDDIDTGCKEGFEYTCANDQPCARSPVFGDRCNCSNIYGMRDCAGVCASDSECSFSRLDIVVSCLLPSTFPGASLAACTAPASFVPFNFVTAVHSILVSLEFTATDGTTYAKMASRTGFDTSLYIVRADPILHPESGVPSMLVTVDVADAGPTFVAAAKLQALFKDGFMAQAPLFVTSLHRVAVMPRTASASIVLWVFVGLMSVGVVAGAAFIVRQRNVKLPHPLMVAPQDGHDPRDLIHDTMPLTR
ncbi:hypothetical protein H310_07296 [Aphanomyces invadans]|uniref:Calx-beta domain-containing protein n=1 Tax=Aphanomyces invadans TaxID=157072 RepID=A0A024U2U1_9STRA|nr:hypothetical protein H310_07296 [Aphanomyces invadans]ETW00751.1 hypothetical protein H310_07296 [Aphanomyces invadans]|eukprot:XP_008870886.1 hypothetical protein H310_07296 [Aphanomyces invadans]